MQGNWQNEWGIQSTLGLSQHSDDASTSLEHVLLSWKRWEILSLLFLPPWIGKDICISESDFIRWRWKRKKMGVNLKFKIEARYFNSKSQIDQMVKSL